MTRSRCPTTTDTTRLVRRRIEDLEAAITAWTKLPADVAEARLFPLAQFIGDVYAGALLTEQAAWEHATRGTDRKSLVARLYARRYLAEPGSASRYRRRGSTKDSNGSPNLPTEH